MQQAVEFFDYSTILHLITGGCVGKDCFVAYMVALTWPLVCLASATIVAFDGAAMQVGSPKCLPNYDFKRDIGYLSSPN